MRAIILIGINFVRTQWIALAVMSAYVLGIGGVYRVHSCVTRILDELTGQMLHMKQPCIILQGVVCNSEYAQCRLNCPRAIPCYWREIWLERVEDVQHEMADVAGHEVVARQGIHG